MKDTADYVKKSRARLGLTQAEFADALGLERRTIMRFEKGDELPLQTQLAIRQLRTLSRLAVRQHIAAQQKAAMIRSRKSR
jgi:DNA-binding XRE family transcriptional regulator